MNNAKKTGDRLLLRPCGDAKWEVWAFDGEDRARLVRTCDSPASAAVSRQSTLALPLRQLFAVPLWLATTDTALMRGMILLQLERKGLASGRETGETIFDYRIVTSLENRTLVLAIALSDTLPLDLCVDFSAYEPSALIQPLPGDEFTLWREGGRLALAVTRGDGLAYFQCLGDGGFTEPVLQELQCIKLQLEADSITGHMQGITLWGDFTREEISGLGKAMDLRVSNVPRPDPAPPAGPMGLAPASVQQARQAARRRSRRFSMMSIAAGAYLLFLSCMLFRVTWFYVEGKWIEAGLKRHKEEVDRIVATSGRWDMLAPAIDPDSYPVELLLRSARLLPAQGVRFTSFDTSPGQILIQGEAGNAGAAFKFSDDMKNSGDLRDYKIEMQSPAMLPNGNAKFQIKGTAYSAATH